jgi:hypothetical protein
MLHQYLYTKALNNLFDLVIIKKKRRKLARMLIRLYTGLQSRYGVFQADLRVRNFDFRS